MEKNNITGPYHNSCNYIIVVEIVPVLLVIWLVCGEGDKYLRCALQNCVRLLSCVQCMLMCQEKENNADIRFKILLLPHCYDLPVRLMKKYYVISGAQCCCRVTVRKTLAPVFSEALWKWEGSACLIACGSLLCAVWWLLQWKVQWTEADMATQLLSWWVESRK